MNSENKNIMNVFYHEEREGCEGHEENSNF